MRLFFTLLMLALPVASYAQDAASPTLAVSGTEAKATPDTVTAVPTPSTQTPAEQILSTFPTWAVSKAGAETGGQPQPASVPIPTTPSTPAAATAAPTPDAGRPPAPASPARPDKLWPRDTIPIFLQSCTGFHHELVAPCSCVITRLMVAMPHDEFLAESADNTLLKDARYVGIRQKCLGTPSKHDDAPSSAQ